jgi:uncharacterized protein (DUF433 family)
MKAIDWRDFISGSPEVMFGKPVVKGTRIPVDLLLEKLACGVSQTELLTAYPNLSSDSITACLLFAADSVKSEVIHRAA